ncbi:MAG: ribonuclease HI [Pirellulaceae bacterium]
MLSDQDDRPIEIELYTDGASRGNPGPGGWAFILRHLPTGKETERAGGVPDSTNNQMELQAVIEGLKALKRPCRLELFTDSEYVRQGLMSWMAKWKANGWRRRSKDRWEEVKNVEQWQELDGLVARHSIKFTRVAGHSGHPENDRCDELAVEAAESVR